MNMFKKKKFNKYEKEKTNKKNPNGTESPIENKFYNEAVKQGLKLKVQMKEGVYRLDFLYEDEDIPSLKVVIEADGAYWHLTNEQKAHDYKRERYLLRKGYIIIRFMGSEIYKSPIKCVKETIETINQLKELRKSYNVK